MVNADKTEEMDVYVEDGIIKWVFLVNGSRLNEVYLLPTPEKWECTVYASNRNEERIEFDDLWMIDDWKMIAEFVQISCEIRRVEGVRILSRYRASVIFFEARTL